jgi:membrane carboxypeptidase/penicillin-binding protein
MDQALRNTPIETPKPPRGITFVKVDIETGLPANGDSTDTIVEAFIDKSVPGEKEDRGKERSLPGTPLPGKSSGGSPAPSGYDD